MLTITIHSFPHIPKPVNQKHIKNSLVEPNSRGGGWETKEKIPVVPNESDAVYT